MTAGRLRAPLVNGEMMEKTKAEEFADSGVVVLDAQITGAISHVTIRYRDREFVLSHRSEWDWDGRMETMGDTPITYLTDIRECGGHWERPGSAYLDLEASIVDALNAIPAEGDNGEESAT